MMDENETTDAPRGLQPLGREGDHEILLIGSDVVGKYTTRSVALPPEQREIEWYTEMGTAGGRSDAHHHP
jgi:hypothetical protein